MADHCNGMYEVIEVHQLATAASLDQPDLQMPVGPPSICMWPAGRNKKTRPQETIASISNGSNGSVHRLRLTVKFCIFMLCGINGG
eukprot:245201-Chlamydomonas_euryale.AAC.7